jgi:hypothetical protein
LFVRNWVQTEHIYDNRYNHEKCNRDGICVNAYPPLFGALGIPANHKAFGAVMVGYPKLRYKRLPLQKEPQITWMS